MNRRQKISLSFAIAVVALVILGALLIAMAARVAMADGDFRCAFTSNPAQCASVKDIQP